jgi:phosphoglycerate dehydrogenase-like enzyme
VIIGICDERYPEVVRVLQEALPGAQIVITAGAHPFHGPVDVLVPLGGQVGADLMDANRPRLIQQFGVGLDGVDTESARVRRIPVGNLSGADTGNAAAAAEIAILHLLALLRRFREAQQSVADRRLGGPRGLGLQGKTVTVLGTGAVGSAVITRLEAFGAIPLGVGRREYAASPAAAVLPPERYYQTDGLTEALARSRVLVVGVPLTETTRGMVGRGELAAMRPGGYLVNVARGPVVDYRALIEALQTGHLAGAGIDVGWREPIDPGDQIFRLNVTVTPHIGAGTVEVYAAMAREFAAKILRLEAGSDIASPR